MSASRDLFRALVGTCVMLCAAIPGAVFAHGGFEERIARISAALKAQPEDPALHLELAPACGVNTANGPRR
ncbi:MAG TPA: hypothetical protein VHO24_17100 [Opitutaceae bacterium]|nr:hypothetical protein [Opitutaceae bacterium]